MLDAKEFYVYNMYLWT